MLTFSLCMIFSAKYTFAGDADKGKKTFKKCGTCHSAEAGAGHKTGPNLWNIYGKKAGSVEGYKYSDWLKNSGIEWNDENRNLLMDNIREVQRLTVEGGAKRNHQQIGKCRNCSRKHVCEESLS